MNQQVRTIEIFYAMCKSRHENMRKSMMRVTMVSAGMGRPASSCAFCVFLTQQASEP